MRRDIFITFLFFVVLGASRIYGNNLVLNPGFEAGNSKLPDKWSTHIYLKDEGTTNLVWLSAGAYQGNRAVFIENIKANDSRVYQFLQVKEPGKYRYSCWLKAEDIVSEGSVGAGISILNTLDATFLFDTQKSWQQLNMYLDVPKGVSELKIAFGIGGFGSLCKGKAWFDEIVFEKLDSFPQGASIVFLNKEQAKPPKIDFPILFVLGVNVLFILMALIITVLYQIKKRRPAPK